MVTPEERKPRYYGRPVNIRPAKVYDFEKCCTVGDIERVIEEINLNGWELICVTPAYERAYFVFFRRLG